MPLTLINNIKMKMQSIELKQHLIDGVPAAKYGEWPGIKPSKWNGGIKIIRPLDQDIFFDYNIEAVEPIKGRRHFSANPRPTSIKPSIKVSIETTNVKYIDVKNKGIRVLTPVYTKNKEINNKKIFPQKYEKSEEDIGNKFQIKTFNHICNQKSANEFSLENMMGARKKIENVENKRDNLSFTKSSDRNKDYKWNVYKELELNANSFTNYMKTVTKQNDKLDNTTYMGVKTINSNKQPISRVKNQSHKENLNLKTINNSEKSIPKDYIKTHPNEVKKQNSNNKKCITKPPIIKKKLK